MVGVGGGGGGGGHVSHLHLARWEDAHLQPAPHHPERSGVECVTQ